MGFCLYLPTYSREVNAPRCRCEGAKRHALKIETRDVKRNQIAREELLMGGEELQVPCLRIGEGDQGYRWMYESSDIIRYLEGRFVVPPVAATA